MHYQTIKKLQNENGYSDMQEKINSGMIWKMSGSQGRYAMDLLDTGICMLPKHTTIDYYGNQIPSRDMLIPGSKGTFKNSVDFWTNFKNNQ